MRVHHQAVVIPRGGWKEIFSAPRNEPLTEYWICERNATSICILCPGSWSYPVLDPSLEQIIRAKHCNNTWINDYGLTNHFKKVHGDSVQQLLAGRGCAGCNKTVPVASLHLHINCMTQRYSAKPPKPASSQALFNDCEAYTSIQDSSQHSHRPVEENPGPAAIPLAQTWDGNIAYNVEHVFKDKNGREVKRIPVKIGGETIWGECRAGGQGETSEGSPRKRLKTVQLPYYDRIMMVPASQQSLTKPFHR